MTCGTTAGEGGVGLKPKMNPLGLKPTAARPPPGKLPAVGPGA
jgi:hypothetical protein